MLTAINSIGMVLLLIWSLSNIAIGISKSRTISNNSVNHYFWQMNIYWNVVNSLIAVGTLVSFISKISSTLSNSDVFTIIQVLGVNSLLDLIYMLVGLVLIKKASKNPSALMKGYGKSIQLQGAFLFFLDLLLLTANVYYYTQA